MMNKLEVGMYVRTIKGEIYKLIDDFALIYFQKEQEYGIPEHQIIKSSLNIIDLIEVGDYVNGEQVSRIKQCPEYHLGDGILIFNEHNETIYSNFRTSKYYDITSIVTKEQFEQIKYEVK